MNTHADKTQQNKSQSVANAISQKQSSSESTSQFVDNRPVAVAQRTLQEMADNSHQAKQLRAFQEMANNSLQFKQAAQLQDLANNHSQNIMGVSKQCNTKTRADRISSDPLTNSSPVQRVSIKDLLDPATGLKASISSQSISQNAPPIQRVGLSGVDITDDDQVRTTDEFRDYTTRGVPELGGGTLTEEEALNACRAYADSGYTRPMVDCALQAVAHGEWDGTTLEHVTGGTIWYHGNATGEHGGAGTTGRQGTAIWLSQNPLTAYAYATPSQNILRYRPQQTLILARLTEVGNQIFGDEIERWSRIAGIHGVFTDYGDGMPEIVVFNVENVQYVDTTTLEFIQAPKVEEEKKTK